jgi:hypothetical protein
MPTKQIQLLGQRGFATFGDSYTSGSPDLPFFCNGYFEKGGFSDTESRQAAFVQRPGLPEKWCPTSLAATYRIMGMISNADKSSMFIFANNGSTNKRYTATASGLTDHGIAPAAAGAWTATGPVLWTRLDGISYGSNIHYAVTDFTKGAVVDSANFWTEITDAEFTGLTKCTNFVGLDGYLFIGTTNNRIYNSELNTATSWLATSFLTAADTPGALIWLHKIRNFLIAFKENSIEFFENIGNPTPGSPLEPRKQYNKKIGCINRSSIQEVSDGIIFAGAAGSGGPKLYKIKKDSLEIEVISDRWVEQGLTASVYSYFSATAYFIDSNVNGSMVGQSQVFHYDGKEFYTINILGKDGTNPNVTQVYDNDLKVWTAWSTSIGAANTFDTYGFAGSQAQMGLYGALSVHPIFADNSIVSISAGARLLVAHGQTPNDLSAAGSANTYSCNWTSDILDFGNRKRKFMDSLEILYQMRASATPNPATSSTIQLKYRDFDYADGATYTVTRTAYIDAGGGARAIFRRFRPFRRRNFSITYSGSEPLKIWAIEANLNQGETDQES